MTTQDIKGILAAVVTPFDQNLEVDIEGIGRQVDFILSNGVHGVVPGGSTGEFTVLTTEERKKVNAAYVKYADGRGTVVAGTGALSTKETIELSVAAQQDGADAVMVVPPFYDVPSFDDLIAHFSAVSDAIDIPIMYYNIPSLTGVDLTPEQFATLAQKTKVTMYKDTGGDATKYGEVFGQYRDTIYPLNGYDTLTFSALALGAKGGVWGAASFIPRLSVDLYEAVALEKDLDKGRALWEKIRPICTFLESYDYAAAIKAGVEAVGNPAGSVRAPHQELPQEAKNELKALIEAAQSN